MKMEYIKRFSLLAILAVLFSCGSTPGEIKNVAMTVEGMSCAHSCAPTIKDKLLETNGVKEAKVSFDTKTALVVYDSGITDPETIKSAVESIAEGAYQITDIKEIAAMPKDSVH
ncbi:MAG: heavy-metal-associated domain-containing protein [Bacteroidetes bacterium]|nr:heavy-metal-associated domain-containing protein [Bacteroidota bacterium]